MTATAYTPADYKKYVYAMGATHLRRIIKAVDTFDDAHVLGQADSEDLTCMLGDILCFLHQAAFADHEGTPDRTDINTYDDGRQVATTVRYGEEDDEFTHVWHPDPDHYNNQVVGAWIEDSQGPPSWRWLWLHVTAPGVFEVHREEDLEAEEQAKVESLTETQRNVYNVIVTKGPGLPDIDIADELGLTEWQVHQDCLVLNALGLCIPGKGASLTEDQARVFYAMPSKKHAGTCVSNAELAEKLGMDLPKVRGIMRELTDLDWVDPKAPTS